MIRVALLFVLVALTTTVFADKDTFYVSAVNGNDTADCTNEDTPCLTLNGTLAQITTDDDITIYFNAGNYTGNLNVGLILPVQEFALEINDNQNSSVVFDCQSVGGTNGINLLYQADVSGISFVNCENGINFDVTVTSDDDEDMLTLTNVEFNGCTRGLYVPSGAVDATDLTVSNCATGLDFGNSTQSVSVASSSFTQCTGASIRVKTVNETTFSVNNCNFTSTAGFSLDAVCDDSNSCEISNSTFVGTTPVDANAAGILFDLEDGFWTFDEVNITGSNTCQVAFYTHGAGNVTYLVLADSVIDNSCAIAVNHTADGPLQVLDSQIATSQMGLLVSVVDTLKVDNVVFSGCTENAISAVVSTDQIDLSDLTLESTGPLSLTVNSDCNGGIVDSTFVSSRVVISGGRWKLNNVNFNGTVTNVQDGGFLHLSSNGNSSSGFEIENSNITGADANGSGGAVFVQGNVNVSIHDNTFTSNKAADGGAIFVADIYAFSMKDNDFTLNSATLNGGAVYIQTNGTLDVYVEDLTFSNNTANNGAVMFCCNGTCSGNITIVQDSDDTLTYEDNGNINNGGANTQLITCNLGEGDYETVFSAGSAYQVSSLDSSGNGWFFWLIVILLILLIVGIIVAAIVGFYFYRKRMSYSRVD